MQGESGAASTVVGFENHSGHTYLGEGMRPLGKVLKGFGNNGQDGWEGCRHGNAIGSYLHGSLLPKNPHLADELILAALERRYGATALPPLDDGLEWMAHKAAVERTYGGRAGSRGKHSRGR
jgi:CobQ-like glutamine amidotransferase family enzyme